MNQEIDLEKRRNLPPFFLQTRLIVLTFLTGFLVASISLAGDKFDSQKEKFSGVLLEYEFNVLPSEIIVGAAFFGALCFLASILVDLKLLEQISFKENVEISTVYSSKLFDFSRWITRIGMLFLLIALTAILSIVSMDAAGVVYTAMFIVIFFGGLFVFWWLIFFKLSEKLIKDMSEEERSIFRWRSAGFAAIPLGAFLLFSNLWFTTPVIFALAVIFFSYADALSRKEEKESEKNNTQGNQN